MKYRGIGALLLAVPLSAAGFSLAANRSESVSANSAPPYWEGASGMGAILAGDQCPIEVQKEQLRFSLTELPAWDIGDAEQFAAYGGKFTAKYTFCNPTDTDYDLRLVFPLGSLPEYYPYGGEVDRTSLGYSIQKDGEDVEFGIRYTLNDARFDLGKGLQRLYPAPQSFYRDDLPVTVYTYHVDVPKRADFGDYVNFVLSFGGSAERTRVFCSEYCSYVVKNGAAKLVRNFDCADGPLDLSVYVLGEDITEPQAGVYRSAAAGAELDETAVITRGGKRTEALSPLALSFREKGCPVSDSDWKNVFIDCIEEHRTPNSFYSNIDPSLIGAEFNLMQWFEYSLSIPAGRTVENTVTAPIYPTIDGSRQQDLYKFTYLLSPAQKWAKFGELTIDIDTPFYLSDSTLEFQPREGGYTFTRSSLPLGELTFTLSEEEIYPPVKNWNYNGDDDTLVTAIVIVCVVAVGAAAVVIFLTVQSRKRKKRREEEERRLLQTRPQEGKIDLPDEDDSKKE